MKTRLITAAAAFALAGGTMVATTGTAHAAGAGAERVASVQAGSASATAAAKKFNYVKPWGSVRGYATLKAIKGVMTDRANDGKCVQVTVYWYVKANKKGTKVKLRDTDRGTVCGKGKSKKFTSVPDYKRRPFKAYGAILTAKPVAAR
ncbi:hypothetical protein ACGFNU_05475 [Spirillospora sp. NPDC048911]|uniref:hypothetical protein n=1 Tax=Spirillospora sp. NPDC048911 TaxID=3364527 RepID=UPI0037237B92